MIHAYDEYGDDFLKEIDVNGMYAFVIYDAVKDSYIAARDPIGIIPLYFGRGRDGSVWFSSEMKALQNHCETFEVWSFIALLCFALLCFALLCFALLCFALLCLVALL